MRFFEKAVCSSVNAIDSSDSVNEASGKVSWSQVARSSCAQGFYKGFEYAKGNFVEGRDHGTATRREAFHPPNRAIR